MTKSRIGAKNSNWKGGAKESKKRKAKHMREYRLKNRELCNSQRRKYYKKNRNRILEDLRNKGDEYKNQKRECSENFRKNMPWSVTLSEIKRRIKRDPSYKNIKYSITKEELKTLWFRDSAFKMKQPSIDRIDTYGNYDFGNCRYLELNENIRRPKRLRENQISKGEACKK